MARKFETDYRISTTAEVVKSENDFRQDVDLRLARVEARDATIDKAVREVTDRGVRFIQDALSPQAAELAALLADYRSGVPAAAVQVTTERRFLSDVELASLQARQTAQQVADAISAALVPFALKASPALTGTPTAPTAAAGTNSTQIATTAFVQALFNALVNGAGPALDQLNELAAALGNDPNFATTVLTALGNRLRVDAAQSLSVAQAKQALLNLNLNQHGQCRLTKSGANLVLLPWNGNKLMVDGAVYSVPSDGVALPPTGLIAFTLYYVYAYMAAGVMTLEASTTGHSTDPTTGVEIKTGDATRTLVGMARPIAGPAWQDTAAQRFVASYFNRQTKTLVGTALSAVSTTSTTGAELSTAGRAEFLTWGDEAVNVACPGSGRSATTTLLITLFIWLDGITATPQSTEYINTANVNYSMNSSGPFAPSEGYHYVTPGALVNNGSFSGIFDVQVNGLVRG